MKTSTIVWALVVIIVVLGGAYWWYTQQGVTVTAPSAGLEQPATGSPQTPQGDGTSVSQNLILGINTDPSVGKYLTAYNGMTVYTYAKDTAGVSNCSGACAVNWPPYTVPSAGSINVSSTITGKVATIVRADGTLQVTYNGMPLYFWKNDANP